MPGLHAEARDAAQARAAASRLPWLHRLLEVTMTRFCPWIWSLLLIAALASGCASHSGPPQTATPSTAMIYGHLDLPEEVRDQIQWIHIYDLGAVYVPPFKTPVVARFFPNGDFYAENVQPGKYYVHHLVAGYEGFYLYPPDMSEGKAVIMERVVEVGAGEIVYLGNHRIHEWKRGLSSKMSPQVGGIRLLSSTPGAGPEPIPNFMNHSSWMTAGSGTFSLEHTITSATETRTLQHILQEVQGTGWDTKVESRLASLR
jgi:hypothetical protein